MQDAAISEARKALNRLRRAAEKTLREMDGLEGALSRAEGNDFPADVYQENRDRLAQVLSFVEDEAQRIQEKVLHTGGLEPGRVKGSW
jgi:hypothetical protein